jgi:nitrogen regulatory protein P-II 1
MIGPSLLVDAGRRHRFRMFRNAFHGRVPRRPMVLQVYAAGNGTVRFVRARGRAVRLVTAVLPPHRLADVHAALVRIGVGGMTVSEATGFGLEMWRTQVYRSQVFHDESRPNVRVEMLVDDADAEDVVGVVRSACASTSSGAGKIWVVPVEQAVRVRTAERGIDAL